MSAIRYGDEFRSRSDRKWRVIGEADSWGFIHLMPLGPDTHSSGGGVKCRYVDGERLRAESHGWIRVSPLPGGDTNGD